MQDTTLGPSFEEAAREFEAAWNDPTSTRFELPPVPINQVLQERYSTEPSFRMTRIMLWDMEVKKAWDPFTYIPYVVSEGHSWGRHAPSSGTEHFFRASMQAAWIADVRGQVLEEVFIEHASRRIFFMGRASFPGETGGLVVAGDHQPLFHVEHAAGGSEEAPLNIWKIVFLTERPDARLLVPFQRMVEAGLLPGFIEIYIGRDQGITLQRQAAEPRD